MSRRRNFKQQTLSKKKRTEKSFLKIPEYPGGKKAFNAFIKENMVYPEEALQSGTEGDVIVTYEVTDNGEVLNPKVKHGIGSGCDEEAVRLISLMKFAGATNRGVRVRSRFNTRIPFRLQAKKKSTQLSFHYSTTKKKEEPQPKPEEKGSYTWQVPLKRSE